MLTNPPAMPPDGDPSWSHYPETVLHFHARNGFTVDLRSPLSAHVRDQLSTLGASNQFAVVTASNPFGGVIGDSENEKRHTTLRVELEDAGIVNMPATGASPDGVHREEGFAVWISRDRARDLAARYDQTAFFWFDGQEFWVVPTAVDEPAVQLPVA
jgi:hypothetical protein